MNCAELNYLYIPLIAMGLVSVLFHRRWGRGAVRQHNRISQSRYFGWLNGYRQFTERDERLTAWAYLVMGLLFMLFGTLGLFGVLG